MRTSSPALFTPDEAKAETRKGRVESTKQGNNCGPRPLTLFRLPPPYPISVSARTLDGVGGSSFCRCCTP